MARAAAGCRVGEYASIRPDQPGPFNPARSTPHARAALLHHAVAALFLRIALHLASDRAAGNGAADRGQVAAGAAADLAADHAADYRACGGAGNAVRIAIGLAQLHVLADHAAAVAEASALVLGTIGLCLRQRRGREGEGEDHAAMERFHGDLLLLDVYRACCARWRKSPVKYGACRRTGSGAGHAGRHHASFDAAPPGWGR